MCVLCILSSILLPIFLCAQGRLLVCLSSADLTWWLGHLFDAQGPQTLLSLEGFGVWVYPLVMSSCRSTSCYLKGLAATLETRPLKTGSLSMR